MEDVIFPTITKAMTKRLKKMVFIKLFTGLNDRISKKTMGSAINGILSGRQIRNMSAIGGTIKSRDSESSTMATGINMKAAGRIRSGTAKAPIGSARGRTSIPLDLPLRMRREYTGDWVNDKKTGKGTMFYPDGNRFDGLW